MFTLAILVRGTFLDWHGIEPQLAANTSFLNILTYLASSLAPELSAVVCAGQLIRIWHRRAVNKLLIVTP